MPSAQMRQGLAKCLLAVALTTTNPSIAKPFIAGSRTPLPGDYPGAPKPIYNDDAEQPYPLNYADEAAQSLGFRNGHMDVFSTKPVNGDPLVPRLSGGVGSDGAMLKLQWSFGE